MKRFILGLLVSSSFIMSSADGEKGIPERAGSLLTDVLNACAKPFQFLANGKVYIENHGAGQMAMKELENKNKTINQLADAVKTISSQQDNGLIVQGIQSTTSAVKDIADTHKETNEILKEGIEKINEEGGLKKAATIVGIGSGVIYIAKSGYFFTSYLYHCIYPSEEFVLRKEQVSQQLKLIRAQAALNDCLGRNMNSIIGDDGMPIKCEESAHVFVQAAGVVEYNKIRKAFAER